MKRAGDSAFGNFDFYFNSISRLYTKNFNKFGRDGNSQAVSGLDHFLNHASFLVYQVLFIADNHYSSVSQDAQKKLIATSAPEFEFIISHGSVVD